MAIPTTPASLLPGQGLLGSGLQSLAPPVTPTVPTAPAAPAPVTGQLASIGVNPQPTMGPGGIMGQLQQFLPPQLAASAPPVDPNYQSHLGALQTKYAQLAPQLSAMPDAVRNALIQFDASRVAQGSAPLTAEQTLAVTQTASNNVPATPEPQRNPLDVLGNLKGDLSDILKSIPRLPIGLVHEAEALPNIGNVIATNEQQGMNPVSAFLAAPGIRMIPGAYTIGGLLQGPSGWAQLASHPLMTALDALPIADHLAAGTAVGQLAEQAAAEAGTMPRPLSAVLTQRAVQVQDEVSGAFAPMLQRNTLGTALDTFRTATPVGQALDAFGGKINRSVSGIRNAAEQRFNAMFSGLINPLTSTEQFAQRAGTILGNYTEQYPFLNTNDKAYAGPVFDQQRADFYNALQTAPDTLHAPMVADLRALQADFAQHTPGLVNINGETYDNLTAQKLLDAQAKIDHTQRMLAFKNFYLNPPSNIDPDALHSMVDDVASIDSRTQRSQAAQAFERTLDAYGVDIKPLATARTKMVAGQLTPDAWAATAHSTLNDPALTLTPRRDLTGIINTLRQFSRTDPQAARLTDAVRRGDPAYTTRILDNLMSRKPPAFPDDLYPAFRDDVRSMSRRLKFDNTVGKAFSDKRLALRESQYADLVQRTPPARFHGALIEQLRDQAPEALRGAAEANLNRALTPEEAGGMARDYLARNYSAMPGLERDQAESIVRTVEGEVARTWQTLRDQGLEPVFVHKVSPGRANQALHGNINPIPEAPSAAKERAFDLSPAIQDIQVSLRHQAGELLRNDYNGQFIDQVMQLVGKQQHTLRQELQDVAYARMQQNPSLDYEAAFQTELKKRYTKFNPEEAGTSWGGAKLDKYRQEDWYIPNSVAQNLKQYATPPGAFAKIVEPVTRAFRYSMIGLSPSVVINEFFSNGATMAAEQGVSPFRYWSEARDWIKHPENIPSDQLKAMVLAEQPGMEAISRDAWLENRAGRQYMQGFNAYHAFADSAAADALRKGKSVLDTLTEKNMHLQAAAENTYRAMSYMDAFDKAIAAGKDSTAAERAAMTQVRKTFVDWGSFTPIERSAMRTVMPFYSFMSHAARFVARYPFDHPLRVSIMSHIANAERERLGALPGGWLSMLPIGGIDSSGHQHVLSLRPFADFGDISDLLSVSGWMAAMNPLIQTALNQVGVVRGEQDIYPTTRYDPETGRMVAVHQNIFANLLNNTIPKAGLLTAALGINPQYNDLKAHGGNATGYLTGLAGVPRLWQSASPFQDMFRAELAREDSAQQVATEARHSGDWTEALRYPSLRPLYKQLLAETPQQIATQQPVAQKKIAVEIARLTGYGK